MKSRTCRMILVSWILACLIATGLPIPDLGGWSWAQSPVGRQATETGRDVATSVEKCLGPLASAKRAKELIAWVLGLAVGIGLNLVLTKMKLLDPILRITLAAAASSVGMGGLGTWWLESVVAGCRPVYLLDEGLEIFVKSAVINIVVFSVWVGTNAVKARKQLA